MVKNSSNNDDNKRTKFIIIVALILGVLFLAIGFATFSTLLTIKSDLIVTPDSKYFKVKFSSTSSDIKENKIVPKTSGSDVQATSAIIDNNGNPRLTNISVGFTKPGDWVEYNFFSYNVGKYMAYLNEVRFLNVGTKGETKSCLPTTDANYDLVQLACGDIKVTINVNLTTFEKTNDNISGHVLSRDKAEPVRLKIEYINNEHWVDGDFNVQFGDIELVYGAND